ncbi:MAG TPA: assimilatory sulfite reductase (NADPH) hemoprotein subunit [Woeseiaceae bacterium]|nr:assimilatory sulfite reductase (NADPH) hemoprotein subunit [Woeseiaceae bacterium]
MNDKVLSAVEHLKKRSNYLRGTLVESLADAATGALAEDDTQLSKFHGFYQQDDRDVRAERTRRKLEPAYSFMVRVRVPGGIATPAQWLALDSLATAHGNGTLRLTTRQAFQFHGIVKSGLKATIRGINDCLLSTIAACGDVNRNIMCTPLAEVSDVHEKAYETAIALSRLLEPRTRAYHEIWLDGERIEGTADSEPIYGDSYLPRKFKVTIAIPPSNDVDVFAHDLGFIAIERNGELAGFNVLVGGGMGATHGEPETYPRVADVIGFCTVEQTLAVAEQVVALQRDYGNRSNRKRARLKYTIDDRGLEWFREALFERLGFSLASPEPFEFRSRGDDFGWRRDRRGRWQLTLFIPAGRIKDTAQHRVLSGLREIARIHTGDFRVTPNQNLIVSGIADDERPAIEKLLAEFGVLELQGGSPLRRQALACVALPTCGLAMAEAERYLPEITTKIETLLERHGLIGEDISLRITGCPNGCARPYLAEIALVGKAPGRYNLFLGGDAHGRRMNRLAEENIDETGVLDMLDRLFARFTAERAAGESFGDFAARSVFAGERS